MINVRSPFIPHSAMTVASILGTLLAVAGPVQAQLPPEIENVESWELIEVTAGEFDQDPGESFEHKRTYSITKPTLLTFPTTSLEGGAFVEGGSLEGDVEVFYQMEETWGPFSGGIEVGEGQSLVLALLPHEPAKVGFVFQVFAPPCEKTWSCALSSSYVIIPFSWSRCYYTCLFRSDWPLGCSGLSPRSTVTGTTNVQFGTCHPNIIFNN